MREDASSKVTIAGWHRDMAIKRLVAVVATAATIAVPAPVDALPDTTRVETYKSGLDFPVDMAWVKGTRKIFFTEKNTGKVRVMKRRRLLARPCVNLDVSSTGERGALGLALHPRFDKNHHLYVYYTNASPLENRVTRFTVRDDHCRSAKHIVTGLSTKGATNHNGGHLEFVRGKLFVSTGDANDASEAQDRSSRLGKILRLNPSGTIPNGNPFDSAVWSYGHRNPFGLGHKPGTRRIYSSENGPDCDDELNRIRKGRNYGWGPGYVCGTAGVGPNPKPPIRRWSEVIVPTDPGWYDGRLKALSGSLYVGDFEGALHRIFLNNKGTRVREDRIVHRASGGIVDVSKGPRGWLYFLTPDSIQRVVRR